MKAKLARLSMALTILASMALVSGAGIKWGALSTIVDSLGF